MGFHVCHTPTGGYVHGGKEPRFSDHSSCDHTVTFANGHKYSFPSAIVYYVYDCGWQPPEEFMKDVLTSSVAGKQGTHTTRTLQTKSLTDLWGTRVGYLSDAECETASKTPWTSTLATREAFVEKLVEVVPALKEMRRSVDPVNENRGTSPAPQ